MAAHQAHPSLGFSRQEHWSGLPFPSPMHESEKGKWSHSVVSDSSWPQGLQPTRLLCPWDFPGKSTGVGCHCLLRIACGGEHKHYCLFFLWRKKDRWTRRTPACYRSVRLGLVENIRYGGIWQSRFIDYGTSVAKSYLLVFGWFFPITCVTPSPLPPHGWIPSTDSFIHSLTQETFSTSKLCWFLDQA